MTYIHTDSDESASAHFDQSLQCPQILYLYVAIYIDDIQTYIWTVTSLISMRIRALRSVSNICKYNISERGSWKKFCHWVRITSVLRFIEHIFITNLQSIPLLLKHIFVTFLPSREKQINSLLLVSVGDTDKQRCQENF